MRTTLELNPLIFNEIFEEDAHARETVYLERISDETTARSHVRDYYGIS